MPARFLLAIAAAMAASLVAPPANAGTPLVHPAASVEKAAPLPALTGRVVDDAHILSQPEQQRLTARLAALEQRTTDQVVVVTLPSLGGLPIEQVGLRLGNGWHIGRKGLNNGVLLIIAPNERKVRIEVGLGLEGLLTNERAAAIIQEKLIPMFRMGAYDGAAEAGVKAIASILESDLRRPQPRRGSGA